MKALILPSDYIPDAEQHAVLRMRGLVSATVGYEAIVAFPGTADELVARARREGLRVLDFRDDGPLDPRTV
ncbi:MAG: hypothetical protein AB7G13_30245 [Lautropia sp.]